MTADLPTDEDVQAAEIFDQYRGLLVAVAYRVLGRHADAEDVVQDAWLRWSGTDRAAVENPEGYLVTVATRLAIDQLRKAQTRKESYVGPWLPEPLLTSAADGTDAADASYRVVLDDTVSLAMLLVMETLSPLERAVFVLREAFDYGYPEIAAMLDRTEPAVRQLLARARTHVQERRPRYPADEAARRRISENFLAACTGASLEPLLELLAPGVVMTSDGGGIVNAARRPIVGAHLVARFLQGVFAMRDRKAGEGYAVKFQSSGAAVNGAATAYLTVDGALLYVYVFDLDEQGLIRDILAVANPEKLAAVRGLVR